jgi:hypothetical protein
MNHVSAMIITSRNLRPFVAVYQQKRKNMKSSLYITGFVGLVLSMTGCHLGPGRFAGRSGGCSDGPCGLLGGGCANGSCGAVAATAGDNGGQPGGALANLHSRNFRTAQSHNGPAPGPAYGPSSPTVTYPYYTTRGPRDFLAKSPPSIGR